MVSKNLTDSGLGTDALHVRKGACSYSIVDAACAAAPGPFYAWAHASVALPDALVFFYSNGDPNLRFVYSADGGTSWTTVSIPAAWTGGNVTVSAVANVCTQDIHIVYGEVGDPTLGEVFNNSVRYRKLTYTGSPGLPSWEVGDAVEIAIGGAGVGYSSPVLAVQRRGCGHTGSIAEGDGRLVMVCLRRTFTTRTWALFTATAPWTLQGAAETPAAIPTASGEDRPGLVQVDDRAYLLTYAGGVYALYRSGELDWGADDAVFVAVDSFSGDVNEGFALASDYLESDTDQGSYVSETRQIAAAYIKDRQVHMREWYVPLTGAATITDRMIWPIKNAIQASISRVGTTYRVSAIVETPAVAATAVIYSDGPLYNAWFAIAEGTGGVGWKWLNVPEHGTSSYDWFAAWGSDDIIPAVVPLWAGRCPLALYQLVNDTGEGDDAVLVIIPLTDTGSGADVATFVLQVVDAGGSVDAVTILLDIADEGGIAEVVSKLQMASDAGVGAELLNVAMAAVDAGAGAEVLRIGVEIVDAGAGADVILSTPTIHVVDTGEGDEALGLVVHVTDAGVGVGVPLISLLLTDTGAGGDVVGIALNVADAAAAAEVLNILYSEVDTGSGSEELKILLSVADACHFEDELSPTIIINLTDTGVGVDSATMVVRVALLVLRLLVAKGVLRLNVKGPGL